MAENKDTESLKQAKTNNKLNNAKIYATFRKYDQYGNDVRARIDITDLVKKEFNIDEQGFAKSGEDKTFNGLYYAANSFVGVEYIDYDEEKNKDGHNMPVHKFPVSRWEDRENYRNKVNDLVSVSLVNAKQADAMIRLIDESFNDFFERTYKRFF